MQTKDNPWLEMKAAAAALDCSVMTIKRLVERGRLEAEDHGAGEINHGYRINPESIAKFKARRQARP